MKSTSAATTTNAEAILAQLPVAQSALHWADERQALIDAQVDLNKSAADAEVQVQALLDSPAADAAEKLAKTENLAKARRQLANRAADKVAAHDARAEQAESRFGGAVTLLREMVADEITKGLRAQLAPFFTTNLEPSDASARLAAEQAFDRVVRLTVAIRAEDDRQFSLRQIREIGQTSWIAEELPVAVAELHALARRLVYFRGLVARGERITGAVPADCVSRAPVYSGPLIIRHNYHTPLSREMLRNRYEVAKKAFDEMLSKFDPKIGYPRMVLLNDPDSKPEFATVRDGPAIDRPVSVGWSLREIEEGRLIHGAQ